MKYRDENGIWQELYLPPTGDTLPIGSITEFAGENVPYGWLICDGSEISRTDYADLFSAIGTTYGSGNGSTTFNLPNLKGKVPVGLDSNDTDFDTLGNTGGEKNHTLTVDEMPAHAHKGKLSAGTTKSGTDQGRIIDSGAGSTSNPITTDTGGGQAHNILQPYIIVNYIIKVKQAVGAVGSMATQYTESENAYYNAPYVNGLISSGNTGDDYYVKFPDGTLICYGLCPSTNTAHNTTSTASVTFAETFINQPIINLTIRAGNDQSTQYLFAAVKTDDNLSGFTFRTRNSGTASSGQDWSARVYYQAIGKWK